MDTTPLKADRFDDEISTPSRAFSAVKTKRKALDRVMATRDITHITPRQIDSFVEDMLVAGQPLNAELMMLSSFGERFLTHLAEVTGHPYDPRIQVNMIQVAETQMGIVQRAGDPTGPWLQFIEFLMMIEARSRNSTVIEATAIRQASQ